MSCNIVRCLGFFSLIFLNSPIVALVCKAAELLLVHKTEFAAAQDAGLRQLLDLLRSCDVHVCTSLSLIEPSMIPSDETREQRQIQEDLTGSNRISQDGLPNALWSRCFMCILHHPASSCGKVRCLNLDANRLTEAPVAQNTLATYRCRLRRGLRRGPWSPSRTSSPSCAWPFLPRLASERNRYRAVSRCVKGCKLHWKNWGP